MEGEGLVSPLIWVSQWEGMVIDCTLAPPWAQEICGVVIVSSELCMVLEGLVLGKCEEVVHAGGPMDKCEAIQGSSMESPFFLQDLRQKSMACLMEKQAVRVEGMLVHYAEVFSHRYHELNKTRLVKHHIYIECYATVKEPPRRTVSVRKETRIRKRTQTRLLKIC